MTSKREIQPLFLLEAISANNSLVSKNVGCASELQGGIISRFSSKFLKSIFFKALKKL
jgi:hypothetical protein